MSVNFLVPLVVTPTVTTDGLVSPGRHTPVDASQAPRAITLPSNPAPGSHLSIEKVDSSSNPVTISGSIRGGASSLTLVWQYESIELIADTAGSWRTLASHKTKAALDAAYLGQSQANPPPWAGSGRKSLYNPQLCTYNFKASNTQRLRAGLGRASTVPTAPNSGVTSAGTCRIAIFGDSKSDQYNGAGVGGYDQCYSKWPWLLKNRLLQKVSGLFDGGTGFIKTYSAGVYDPRLTLTGSWTNSYAGAYSVTGSAGDTLSFSTATTGEKGTIVDVVYSDYQNSQWTVSVDNATSGLGFQAITNNNSALRTLSLTGLPDATHSLLVKNSAANNIFLEGVAVRRNYGLIVDNYSLNGGATTHFLPTSGLVGATVQAYTPNPDVVIIMLGINDLNSLGLSASQVMANLTSIRAQYSNSDVILVLEDQTSVFTPTTWQGFATALYTLADALDVPLIDLYDRTGSATLWGANGMAFDGVHQNAAGDSVFASTIANAIASVA